MLLFTAGFVACLAVVFAGLYIAAEWLPEPPRYWHRDDIE